MSDAGVTICLVVQVPGGSGVGWGGGVTVTCNGLGEATEACLGGGTRERNLDGGGEEAAMAGSGRG